MRAFTTVCLLAGLVAAAPQKPTDPVAGKRCCAGGTTDPNNFCKGFQLNAFCCSAFASDRPSGGKGFLGGCDGNRGFPTGRDVQQVSVFGPQCDAGNGAKGFVGCA
ncbi:hypothetical protein PspLS_11508 [Pyricularia sp. CBS 133598]|nr:hypothetical protein PspLS_11508 [Pyricularia sp. CBS 133598]